MGTPASQPHRAHGARHRWLLVLPFVWQVGFVPLVNEVTWTLGHIPFPMLWQMAGILFTTIIIGWVFRRDQRAGVEGEEAEFARRTSTEGAGEQR